MLAPVALVRRRREIAGLSRSELGWIVGSGVCLAVHFGTWVTSLSMTSVASSTAIVCLQIAWVVAWDRFTGVRLPVRAVVGLVLAFLGVLVITGVDLSVSTRALAGDLLALAGSVAVAAYTVIGGRARRTASPRPATRSSATAPPPCCCSSPAWSPAPPSWGTTPGRGRCSCWSR